MERPIVELWTEYLFLTKEMSKALVRNDFPLFEEILQQREHFQEIIDKSQDKQFVQTVVGQELVRKIAQENKVLQQEFHFYASSVQNKVVVAKAYEEGGLSYTGGRMDRQS